MNAPESSHTSSRLPRTVPGSVRIFLVSDSTTVCAKVTDVLNNTAVQLDIRALDSFESRAPTWPPLPTLLLLDVDNNLSRGERLLERVKRNWHEVPVVVLTSDLSADFGKRILSKGVRYHFSHDFCPNDFSAVVTSLINRSSA